MRQNVGRITLAVALIAAGGLLVLDNLTHWTVAGAVARLWPALLILLGLEWLWATSRLKEGERARMDGGAIALLVIIALIAAATGDHWHADTLHLKAPRVDFSPGAIAPLGNVASQEILLRDQSSVSDLKTVSVQTGSGTIAVQPGEQFSVELRVRGYGRNVENAEQNARTVSLQVTPGPTTEVRANYPQNLSRVDLNFNITVPKGVALQLKTASGSIHVTNTEGQLTAESASGSISTSSVKGTVDLHSASGTILAENTDGSLSASTASGAIRVDLVSGKITANSVSGGVDIQNAGGAVNASTVSGRLNVRPAKVAGDYQLRTTSGQVMVSLPADAAVTVKAKSASGLVSGDSWLILGEGRNSASGTLGGGTYKVTIDTTSGGIAIGSR